MCKFSGLRHSAQHGYQYSYLILNIIKLYQETITLMLKLFYWKEDREAVMFINRHGLLVKNLPNLNLKALRKQLAQFLVKEKNAYPKIQSLFATLRKDKKDPNMLWVALVLAHLLSQVEGQTVCQLLCEALCQEVGKTLDLIKEFSKKKELKGRLSSTEDTKTERKKITEENKKENSEEQTAEDVHSKYKSLTFINDIDVAEQLRSQEIPVKPTGEDQLKPMCRQTSIPSFQDKEEFLCMKILVPYSMYLQKLLRWKSYCTERQKQNGFLELTLHEVWKMINVYKAMMSVSRTFTSSFRYYQKYLNNVIFNLTLLFDFEVKVAHTLLENSFNKSLKDLQKKYETIVGLDDKEKKAEELRILASSVQIQQTKEILLEISKVNDSMQYLYRNRYTKKRLLEYCETVQQSCYNLPEGFNYEMVLDILALLEKQTNKRKKVQNLRLNKLSIAKNNISQEHPKTALLKFSKHTLLKNPSQKFKLCY